MSGKKVVIGLSGGVDSSVAAYLLKKQGYDVIGVTMQIWQKEDVAENGEGCSGLAAVEDARKVAELLEIPYHVLNFREEFQKHVIDYFVDEYLHGRTPNPCVVCNRYVKWEALMNRGKAFGADYIATGHYSRVEKLPNGRYAIRHSATSSKDQTYALYNLTQEQLSRTLMPVGEFEKDEIRKIAEEIQLPVAHKSDSQDICFIPDGDYASFIDREVDRPLPKGKFVTVDGKVLGEHKGITHYTVGQRKGLGLSLGHPAFVLEIRPETNEVVIGSNEDSLTRKVVARKVNFMAREKIEGEMRAFAKIRYNHKGGWCTLSQTGEDEVTAIFDEPVRAVTPGQALVAYEGEYVLLGGIIER